MGRRRVMERDGGCVVFAVLVAIFAWLFALFHVLAFVGLSASVINLAPVLWGAAILVGVLVGWFVHLQPRLLLGGLKWVVYAAYRAADHGGPSRRSCSARASGCTTTPAVSPSAFTAWAQTTRRRS
jgi:hypothetical protein